MSQTDVRLVKREMLRAPLANPAVAAEFLTNEDTFATVLLVLALDTFPPTGDERQSPVLGWHPETVKMELEQTFGVAVPKVTLDKLMTAIMIKTTDLFFKDEAYFVEFANILCGDDFEPDEFDPADALECAWAVMEGLLIHPPTEEEPEPFSDTVRHYIAFVLREEGFIKPPGILKIALDADFSAKVDSTFADDPAMFEGIYQAQQEKSAEIESILKAQLADLTSQLSRLPLQTGSTAELVTRMRGVAG